MDNLFDIDKDSLYSSPKDIFISDGVEEFTGYQCNQIVFFSGKCSLGLFLNKATRDAIKQDLSDIKSATEG